jgi:hypothetical protein
MTSRPWNDTEASALAQTVSRFTTYYDGAVKQSHTPTDSWLVLNEYIK